ncbi:MAG: TonB-dependent receptor plug domain-containing protein, partial [Muribaculaceae bacterium]|nr:TonB-dependent receptor plug domain-containing protein [Muribaculaceae bacterium]
MKKTFFPLAMTAIGVCNFNVFADSTKNLKDSISTVLDELEVVANRANAQTPVAFTNISKKELLENNDGRDITYLLQATPSVITTSDAGAGIGYTSMRVRGTDGSRINVTANGIPINNPESHNVYWVNMPDLASSLRDVQIQRGAGTSTNGAGAFGASINMITDAPSETPYAEVSGAYGMYNTNRETLRVGSGSLGGHWSFDARISHLGSDGYIERASTQLWSYFGQAAYKSYNTQLRLLAFGGKEKTYMAWDYASKEQMEKYGRRYNPCGEYTDSEGNRAYYSDQNDNFVQHHFQLLLTQHLGDYFYLNAALHYTKDNGYYDQYKTNRTLEEYGLIPFYNEAGEKIKKSDLIRLKNNLNHFGGGAINLNFRNQKWNATLGIASTGFYGHHFGQIKWVRNYIGAIDPLQKYYDNAGHKFDINSYIRANYQINSLFSAFADLQFRHIR